MLQAVGVVAVTAIRRAARGLHVRGVPSFRADGAQKSGGVEGACAHLHVVGLQDHATLLGPVTLQGEDQSLEGAYVGRSLVHKFHRFEAFLEAGQYTQATGNPHAALLLVYR